MAAGPRAKRDGGGGDGENERNGDCAERDRRCGADIWRSGRGERRAGGAVVSRNSSAKNLRRRDGSAAVDYRARDHQAVSRKRAIARTSERHRSDPSCRKGQSMKILQPPSWARPKGFSNGVAAKGEMIFVSGTVGWDADGKFVSNEFVGQARQALKNIVEILAEAKAKPEHITRMTWYVVDKKEYLAASKELGAVYREIVGGYYPAMTAVQGTALIEDQAKVEIEVTAVILD